MDSISFWIVLMFMFIGLVGNFLPVIPGSPIIFLAALVYAYLEKFQQVTPLYLIILFLLMSLTFFVDYLAGMIGAKKYGASKLGIFGSLIGGIVGVVFFNIVGLIIGPFVGAVLGELIQGRPVNEAVKAGIGTLIGLAGGVFFKLLVSIIMIGIFIVAVF